MIEAYPLTWPPGFKRTANPTWSRFGEHTLSKATSKVVAEIERIGGSEAIISTNIPLRKDGYPRADYLKRNITDYGAAVYFIRKKKQVVLACDKWDNIEDNLWGIALTIEAMRGLERWGASDILERAFTGFTALPMPAQRSCWEILEIDPTDDIEAIKEVYKLKAIKKHPDGGGTHEAFVELQRAYENALNEASSK